MAVLGGGNDAARRGEAMRVGAQITNNPRTHVSSEISRTPAGGATLSCPSVDGGSRRPSDALSSQVSESGARPLFHVKNRSTEWQGRDAILEEEILCQGQRADTVFLCAGPSPTSRPEPVYGQAALFALLSPVLRERLYPLDAFAIGIVPSSRCDDQGRQQVCLTDEVSASGFREVARYVYRLPHRFTLENSPEIVAAARVLQLPELDQGVIGWGLSHLEALASARDHSTPKHNGASDALEPIEHALRCFAVLCMSIGNANPSSSQARHASAVAWRDALLQAFNIQEIISSAMLLELTEDAMLLLLEGSEIHVDPSLLWERCVWWAQVRRQRVQPPPRKAPWCTGPDFVLPTRKLFVPGARLATMSAPPPPEHKVDWQRWLLRIAEITHFKDMTAASFAAQMDSIDPMLPELRQIIYKVRRQELKQDANPLEKVLRDCL
jgi:hypothetical protein